MKQLLWIGAIGLSLVGCGHQNASTPAESAKSGPAPSTMAAEPATPLLDREVFFGNAEVAFGNLSPDGKMWAFSRELDGILNIWVNGVDAPLDQAWPITDDRERPVTNFFWSQDGRFVLFAQDLGGDENFRIYAVDPKADKAEGSRVPAARDLTPYENIQARIVSVPENDPTRILVAINDRDPRLHDVYRVNLDTAERELVRQNNDNIAGWQADLEGNLRLAFRILPDGGTEVLDASEDELREVYRCANGETCNPIRFTKDGKKLFMATNRGDRDLVELVMFDPATGEEQLIERDPEGQVDFGNAIFSRATDELIATSYTGDRVRIYPKDDTFARDIEVIRKTLTRGDLFFRAPSNDDNVWIVKEVLDIDSGPNYVYHRDTGEVRLLYRPEPNIPVEHMAEMKGVRYTARDGLEIPAYLILPKGVEPTNLPTVIMPHGGPWARDQWGWNPLGQFLANRGYAVLQPNFRGSTGYGKAFLAAGNGEWGTGAMQHDISDGVQWLVNQGISDPGRIAIMGGSYGGYATLAGVAFTPDLYAAGVSIVGPSSILTLLESIPPYWEPVKKMFHARVGDPAVPEELERLKAQSPLYHADNIKSPLMIIQGANDPRVKRAESDQIVVAMRDLGREVEYLVAEDEGHGFANEINNLASYAAVENFLSKHLGGRNQESMSSEVGERLADLTVDVDFLNRPGADGEGAEAGGTD